MSELNSIETAPKDCSEFYLIIARNWVYDGYVGIQWCRYSDVFGFITLAHSNDVKIDINNKNVLGWSRTYQSAERIAKRLSSPKPKTIINHE